MTKPTVHQPDNQAKATLLRSDRTIQLSTDQQFRGTAKHKKCLEGVRSGTITPDDWFVIRRFFK